MENVINNEVGSRSTRRKMDGLSVVFAALLTSLLAEGLLAAPTAPVDIHRTLILVQETGRFLTLSSDGEVTANGDMHGEVALM